MMAVEVGTIATLEAVMVKTVAAVMVEIAVRGGGCSDRDNRGRDGGSGGKAIAGEGFLF